MKDSPLGGRLFRTLNVIDDFNREVLTMEIATHIPAARAIRTLDHLKESRGLPKTIRVDNGPEYISKLLQQCAKYNALELLFVTPCKPTQNSLIERKMAYADENCSMQISSLISSRFGNSLRKGSVLS